MSGLVFCLACLGVAFGFALIAKLSVRWLVVALNIIRRRPECAVRAEMPRVASSLSLAVNHDDCSPSPGVTREICKICYRVNRIGFAVPDAVWKQVVPANFADHVVCLDCFTRLADEKRIDWSKAIEFFPVSFISFCQH
jgi:hypothetical protein